MPDSIALGSILLNGVVLSRVLAGFGAWLAIRWWAGKRGAGQTADVLGNAFVIVLLFWRFGWVLYDPAAVWEEPGKLLLMSGSSREVWTGIAVGGAYAVVSGLRRGIAWRLWLDVGVVAGLVYGVIFSALSLDYGRVTEMPWGLRPVADGLRYHPIHLYRAAGFLMAAVMLHRRSWPPGSGRYAADGAMYFGVVLLAVSFFDRAESLVFMLTFDQIAAVVAIALGYVVSDRRILNRERSGRAMTESPLDSRAQQRQARDNAKRMQEGKRQITDKKLDGPDRPAE